MVWNKLINIWYWKNFSHFNSHIDFMDSYKMQILSGLKECGGSALLEASGWCKSHWHEDHSLTTKCIDICKPCSVEKETLGLLGRLPSGGRVSSDLQNLSILFICFWIFYRNPYANVIIPKKKIMWPLGNQKRAPIQTKRKLHYTGNSVFLRVSCPSFLSILLN